MLYLRRSVPSSTSAVARELRVADHALGVLLAAGDEHRDEVRALGLRGRRAARDRREAVRAGRRHEHDERRLALERRGIERVAPIDGTSASRRRRRREPARRRVQAAGEINASAIA